MGDRYLYTSPNPVRVGAHHNMHPRCPRPSDLDLTACSCFNPRSNQGYLINQTTQIRSMWPNAFWALSNPISFLFTPCTPFLLLAPPCIHFFIILFYFSHAFFICLFYFVLHFILIIDNHHMHY